MDHINDLNHLIVIIIIIIIIISYFYYYHYYPVNVTPPISYKVNEAEILRSTKRRWGKSSDPPYNDSFLESNLSYAAIFREAPDWPVVMT